MKKTIIILMLLFSANLAKTEAQTTKATYYAIDGSTWMTNVDRDKKEDLIWERINLNVKAAQNAGRLGSENAAQTADTLLDLFHQCRMLFSTIRLENMGKDGLRSIEFRFFLSQNDVDVKNGVARNGEIFNMDEYAFAFDIVLREYHFNAKIMEELANPQGRDYNISFITRDFLERVADITVEVKEKLQEADEKNKAILQLIPKYKEVKKHF